MRRSIAVVAAIVVSLVVTGAGVAQESPAPPASWQIPTVKLSTTQRGALDAEMRGRKDGVVQISVAIVQGDWELGAETAARMRDRSIMKGRLTRKQIEELDRSLPAALVKADERLRQDADALGRAMKARNGDLAVSHFSKMLRACVGCHVLYATHVFRGFPPAGNGAQPNKGAPAPNNK